MTGIRLNMSHMILGLFGLNAYAKRSRCHENYISYRLLAEGMRVDDYLRKSGISLRAGDLLPWSWQKELPWIMYALKAIDIFGRDVETVGEKPGYEWILEQLDYHKGALSRIKRQKHINDTVMKTALVITVISYLAALVFEIYWGGMISGVMLLPKATVENVRTVIKIITGALSAGTLFAGNYYGKLSLDESAEDHERMISLLLAAQNQIDRGKQSETVLKALA